MKPTIGRVVWYRPLHNEGLVANGTEPLAAHICGVTEDGLVNLVVFDFKGQVSNRVNVKLVSVDAAPPDRPYAEWVPYQISQPAKDDEAVLVDIKRGPGRPRKE